jgi:hypothetical protein
LEVQRHVNLGPNGIAADQEEVVLANISVSVSYQIKEVPHGLATIENR